MNKILSFALLLIFGSVSFDVFAKEYSLTINATPSDSQIRIMTIQPKYKPGILLAPGTYQIKINKEGYSTQTINVTIKNGAETRVVRLTAKPSFKAITTPIKYPRTIFYDLFLVEEDGTEEKQNGVINMVNITPDPSNGNVQVKTIMGTGKNQVKFITIVDKENQLIMSSIQDIDGYYTINKTNDVRGMPTYKHEQKGSSSITQRNLLDNYRPVDLYGLMILSIKKHLEKDYKQSETLKLFVGRSTTLISLVGIGSIFKRQHKKNYRNCHGFLIKDQQDEKSLELTICTDTRGYTYPTDMRFLKQVFTAGKIHWKLNKVSY